MLTQIAVAGLAVVLGMNVGESLQRGKVHQCADNAHPQAMRSCKSDLRTPLDGDFRHKNIVERYADGYLVRRETYSPDGRIMYVVSRKIENGRLVATEDIDFFNVWDSLPLRSVKQF